MMTLSLLRFAIDGLLVLLLLSAMIYAYRLMRQLRQVKAGKNALNQALSQFIKENEKAQQAIFQMQKNAQENRMQLEKLLAKGVPLRDDLAQLVKQSNGAKNTLSKRLDRHLQLEATQAKLNQAKLNYTHDKHSHMYPRFDQNPTIKAKKPFQSKPKANNSQKQRNDLLKQLQEMM